MKAFKVIGVIGLILLIFGVVGYLNETGVIHIKSNILAWIVYVCAIPFAFLIKWIKGKADDFEVELPATYQEHKEVREAAVKELEDKIAKRKREIAAIEAAERANKEQKSNQSLTDLAQWGKDLLNRPIERTD